MPPLPILFVHGFWVDEHLHAEVEEWVRLSVVQQIELYASVFLRICHSEEKPYAYKGKGKHTLGVAFGVYVILED